MPARLIPLALLLATVAAPAPAQTPAPGPIPDPTPGTVTVTPLPEDAASAPARALFADAAARALAAAGFTPLPGQGGARWTARLTLTRTPRGTVATAAPVAGPAAALGDWGASAIVSLPSRKTQLRRLIVTELAVALVPRGADAPAWTGRALTVQAEDTANDAPARLAGKLAAAALTGFPQPRDTPVSVP